MGLLKDIPICADILDGAHDDQLHNMVAAINHRRKVLAREGGLRVGATVRFVDDPAAGHLAGKEAVVRKVNRATVSVDLTDGPEWERGYRVTPNLLVAA